MLQRGFVISRVSWRWTNDLSYLVYHFGVSFGNIRGNFGAGVREAYLLVFYPL